MGGVEPAALLGQTLTHVTDANEAARIGPRREL